MKKIKLGIIAIFVLALSATTIVQTSISKNDSITMEILDVVHANQLNPGVKTNCYAGGIMNTSYFPTCKSNCPYEYMSNPEMVGKCTID